MKNLEILPAAGFRAGLENELASQAFFFHHFDHGFELAAMPDFIRGHIKKHILQFWLIDIIESDLLIILCYLIFGSLISS